MSDDITMDRIVIGPALATEMLDMNNRNRRLSSSRVTQYADAMRNGLWQFDGSPIRFDVKGNVIDGQHRLWAIVETELEFEFLVIRNLPTETFATIDTGKQRSFADMISIEFPGVSSSSHLAALTQIIYRWEQGERGNGLDGKGKNPVPPALLMQFFRDNSDTLIEISKLANRVNTALPGIGRSVLGLGIWMFGKIDAEDTEFFFERLRDGEALPAGSPILAMRKLAAKHVKNTGDNRSRIPTVIGTALLIKAWNAYREGTAVQVLAFRAGGAKPERWPVPK